MVQCNTGGEWQMMKQMVWTVQIVLQVVCILSEMVQV